MFTNQKNLTLINDFGAFIELVTNPAQFAAAVEEAKKVNQRTEELLGAKAKIDEADKIVQEAKQLKEQVISALEAREQALNKRQENFDLRAEERTAVMDKKEQEIAARAIESEARAEALSKKEASVAVVAQAQREKEKQLQEYDEELRKQAKELNDKANRLKELLK